METNFELSTTVHYLDDETKITTSVVLPNFIGDFLIKKAEINRDTMSEEVLKYLSTAIAQEVKKTFDKMEQLEKKNEKIEAEKQPVEEKVEEKPPEKSGEPEGAV